MTPSTPSADERQVPLTIAAGLMIVAMLALYWPALGVGFLGDDFMILHRLRGLERAIDVVRFFKGEFFEYYRPLGFVSQAIDWAIAGANARQFHLTNLLIHVVNSILIVLIGRTLSPRPGAGLVAAALYCLMRGVPSAAGALVFFLALLSKEAAVALPIAPAAWSAFRLRRKTWETSILVAPWLAALLIYSVLRHFGGGISAVGGASRIPKLTAFIAILIAVVALSSERWERLKRWLKPRRRLFAAVSLVFVLAVILGAWSGHGRAAALAREKLSVAGFTTFYLASPVLGPGESVFGDAPDAAAAIVGVIGIVAVIGVLFLLWHRFLEDDRYWFLGALLVATLLPISALTEGKRYLYLPSAAVSLITGILVVESRGRSRRLALAVVAGVLAVSSVQIVMRLHDWQWAGQMTAEGAQLVDSTLAPACGTGHVVFLTSPVGMRGVYSHFYYETFEVPRGCIPEVFQVVTRVVRVDTPIDVKWDGPDQLVISASEYRDNFLLSQDLREFNVRLRTGARVDIQTPLGRVTAEASQNQARVVLTLSDAARREPIQFFYYSGGRIQALRPVR
jgi:hypothetical protein